MFMFFDVFWASNIVELSPLLNLTFFSFLIFSSFALFMFISLLIIHIVWEFCLRLFTYYCIHGHCFTITA